MKSLTLGASVLAVGMTVASAAADPTTGFTLQPLQFNVQRPYNVPVSQRYNFDARTNVHHCWVYNTDQPFSEGNTTDPRTEMRFNPDYTTATAYAQFEADIMVPAGTNDVSIFQIHVGDSESDADGSTSFMMFMYGGQLREYSGGPVIVSKPYGKWIHFNFIHNTAAKTVAVYVNNNLVNTFGDNATGQENDWYFKAGVYGQSGQSALCQAYYRNVHIWGEP
ncbi:MAG TPA: polysaccharide lyase family 7 protein [Tepidisphaeraceae bacterium]|nr:polysaccharide lyase family 7 protein [Tepidisphaeraceae bacterium]